MSRPLFRHGLVIGKFYPPHLGHEYLIRAAALHCRAVTVAVLGSSAESLSIAQREQWLRDAFADTPNVRIVGELDDVPVDYHDDAIWQAHVDIMRRAIRQADAHWSPLPPVDAVFSSEPYGDRLASYFECPHVCLDQARSLYPTSGTAVRADLPSQWHMLSPAVQAGMALRVVVVGAESTGTTTLSRDLATALRQRGGVWKKTLWVAEYGREYSANLMALTKARTAQATAFDIVWESPDFVHVAQEQCRTENAAAAHGSPVLVCDTDAMATRIWHERYMGCDNALVDQIAAAMPPRALYILTSDQGVPFEDDGLRDGEHLRQWMTQRFRDALVAQAVPWIEVHGTPQARCHTALQTLDTLMARQWAFTPLLQSADMESH
jgi:HTH-type transcriptional repressor of NAD biosynthesis genes